MKHSLSQRLTAWVNLLQARPDLSFDEAPVQQLPPFAPVASFGPHATAAASEIGGLQFSYQHNETDRSRGSLYLSLEGVSEDAWLELDGEDFEGDRLIELDADFEGTGSASWLLVENGVAERIAFGPEDPVVFANLEEYLTTGAKRGFEHADDDWQHLDADEPPELLKYSWSADTDPKGILSALVARGAPEPMARDLMEWLGDRVVLLLPR